MGPYGPLGLTTPRARGPLPPPSRLQGGGPRHPQGRQGAFEERHPGGRSGPLPGTQGPLPQKRARARGEYLVPLGRAEVVRPGRDLTLISYSLTLHKALEAAEVLARGGVEAEVVDLKTLYPLDWETLLASVENTGRAVVAHEAWRFLGLGAEIAATLEERLWRKLKAPVARVGAAHVPIPFSPPLERRVLPQVEDILKAAQEVMAWP